MTYLDVVQLQYGQQITNVEGPPQEHQPQPKNTQIGSNLADISDSHGTASLMVAEVPIDTSLVDLKMAQLYAMLQ